MQMVRVLVVDLFNNRVLIDKECDFHTAEGRRYIAEHAQRAMANGDAILTFPAAGFNERSRIAKILSDYSAHQPD